MTATEEFTLESCPFCKAEPNYQVNEANGYHFALFTQSDTCFFTGVGMQYDNVGELMASAWNRRAES